MEKSGLIYSEDRWPLGSSMYPSIVSQCLPTAKCKLKIGFGCSIKPVGHSFYMEL